MADCLFCRIVSGTIPSKRVFEDDRCLAFEDVNPQSPTHVLVVPRRHVATLNELPTLGDEGETLVGHLLRVAAEIAKTRGHDGPGYRVVVNCNAQAGQTVFHLHVHLLAGRQMSWPPG
ncbi:MAG: histidine triad nucleotide-binding protein [Deltaproteobacteria bacterium]